MVHRRGIVSLFALAAMCAACKKPPPPAPEIEDAAAPDHLSKGEIAVGRDTAFSLPLPLESEVQYRLIDAVSVESSLRPEELSNYVRAHVQTTKIVAGAQTTTFDEAVVPTDPKRILKIVVRPTAPHRSIRSSMMVRDVTPPPPPPQETPEEAWKRLGRGPDGKPLDPKHLQ